MTPLYAGIGGVVREIKELYTGVGGVVKPLTEMWAGVGGVNRQIFSAGTPVGDLSVGDVIQLRENLVPVDYIVVHQGLPSSMYDASCDGTWLLRKDIAEKRVWDRGNSNVLETSDIQAYLNGDWMNRYDLDVAQAIKQVKIPYCVGGGSATVNSGANGLSCKIFLLSGYEVGFRQSDNQYFPIDGAKLSYFEAGTGSSARNKRIAKLNGSATNWWLRSPDTVNTGIAWRVGSNGNSGNGSCTLSYGIRPALVLPSDFLI